jgi:hypothetical protein
MVGRNKIWWVACNWWLVVGGMWFVAYGWWYVFCGMGLVACGMDRFLKITQNEAVTIRSVKIKSYLIK